MLPSKAVRTYPHIDAFIFQSDVFCLIRLHTPDLRIIWRGVVLCSPRGTMREVRSFLSYLVHWKGDQHEASSGYHIRASRTNPGCHWHLGTELAAGASATGAPFCASRSSPPFPALSAGHPDSCPPPKLNA